MQPRRLLASSWLLLIFASTAESCRPSSERALESSAILPAGAPTDFWKPSPIGEPPADREQPQIANVAVVDLDGDGLMDVLVCDAGRRKLSWLRQAPKGEYTEQLIAEVRAPGHV